MEDRQARASKKRRIPADSLSAYRPIVMLDEADKLFERIIAGRLILAALAPVYPTISLVFEWADR